MKQAQATEVGAALKKYRVEHDLTLEEVARSAEITASTVYRIENGHVEPNDRTLFKLKKALPGFLSEISIEPAPNAA